MVSCLSSCPWCRRTLHGVLFIELPFRLVCFISCVSAHVAQCPTSLHYIQSYIQNYGSYLKGIAQLPYSHKEPSTQGQDMQVLEATMPMKHRERLRTKCSAYPVTFLEQNVTCTSNTSNLHMLLLGKYDCRATVSD